MATSAPSSNAATRRPTAPGPTSGWSARNPTAAPTSGPSARSPARTEVDWPASHSGFSTTRTPYGSTRGRSLSASSPTTTSVSSTGAPMRFARELSIRGRPRYGASSFPPPNRLPDPAARSTAETLPRASGTAPPVGEGQLVVLRGVHVRGQRSLDLHPAHPLRMGLDELPHRLVPVQTAQILEGLPREDERVPELSIVGRHRSPRPRGAPLGEHRVYEPGLHARLVAEEQHEGRAVLPRRVHSGEQRRGAARAVGGVLHHRRPPEVHRAAQLPRSAAQDHDNPVQSGGVGVADDLAEHRGAAEGEELLGGAEPARPSGPQHDPDDGAHQAEIGETYFSGSASKAL